MRLAKTFSIYTSRAGFASVYHHDEAYTWKLPVLVFKLLQKCWKIAKGVEKSYRNDLWVGKSLIAKICKGLIYEAYEYAKRKEDWEIIINSSVFKDRKSQMLNDIFLTRTIG